MQAGVTDVCISPGSRSTPLTIALARQPDIQVWTLLDERSAGFFAYGLARTSGRTVVLVCTSGTAPANYMPAVVEAYQTRVPLLIVTADRPPELHGVGSNQTVDQEKLYGSFVKQYFSMPVPENTPVILQHARSLTHRAVSLSQSVPMGPVHINWPFREPLLPPLVREPLPERNSPLQVWNGSRQFSEQDLARAADFLSGYERGLIICGPQDRRELVEPLLQLAERLQFPVLADPLSQIRTAGLSSDLIIDNYDAILRIPSDQSTMPSAWEWLKPQLIIRVGQTPTSKVLGQFLASLGQIQQLVIDDSEMWQDPFFTATTVWKSEPVHLFSRLSQLIARRTSSLYAKRWQDMTLTVQDVLTTQVPALPELFEGRVWQELAELLPEGSILYAGNSMPVRDMDTFFPTVKQPISVFANRGASGIDGIVSSALGASAAAKGPVVLVIGDLSFYHDLNGLLAAKLHQLGLIVVLIHNDGGGIFSFLPQASQTDVFPYFSTSHGLEFESVIQMYGGQYQHAQDWRQFRKAMTAALRQQRLQVIELRTEREANVLLHQQIISACQQAVAGLVTSE